MTIPSLPEVALSPEWVEIGRGGDEYVLTHGGDNTAPTRVRIRRSVVGLLRDAYPASLHDIEVIATECAAAPGLAGALDDLSGALLEADPRCRRVVLAIPTDESATVNTAVAAGYRYVVDVDLGSNEFSLLVAEPDTVTVADRELEHVPGT